MKYRVLRGGSYYFGSRYLRTADRIRGGAGGRYRNYGFRIVVRRVKAQK